MFAGYLLLLYFIVNGLGLKETASGITHFFSKQWEQNSPGAENFYL